MTVAHTYTYEVALLVNIQANNVEQAKNQLDELLNEVSDVVGWPDTVTSLCHISDEKGESIFVSDIEFVPYPLYRKIHKV
jgi:hypothetical protein